MNNIKENIFEDIKFFNENKFPEIQFQCGRDYKIETPELDPDLIKIITNIKEKK